MAALSTLAPLADRAMQNAKADFTPLREIHIGRLELGVIGATQSFKRNWERVDNVGSASYVLAFPLNGSLAFSQDGRIGIAAPGEYVLLSELAFYELSSDGMACLLMMRIPATELRGRVASVEDHVSRRFKANEHMTRLLVGLITSIVDLFVDRPPPNPQALATEIVSFVALTIGAEDRGATSDVRNTRYHLRRRIFDFIEKHLSDPNLSPKKIAASSRISLSYLYSLFNDDDTTVGQFVQVKRLQRAYEILVGDPRGHRTVSEIAYEVGFKNVSHFSRTFSRHFRIPPRDVRKLSHDSFPEIASAAAPKAAMAPKSVTSCDHFGLPRWETNRRRSLHENA
jgi:AraC-like DNA-binding protein